ncbi:MAG TPA: hypothetical protein VIM89_05535 [Mucilaginibacter sp.]
MIEQQKKEVLTPKPYEYDVRPVAYYNIKRVNFENKLEECVVVERAGEQTIFDEMITLNKRWYIKTVWRKYRKQWWNYYSITATNEDTGKSREFDLYPKGHTKYFVGIINYTNLNYFIVSRERSFQIYIYEGTPEHMLEYWEKYNKGESSLKISCLVISMSKLLKTTSQV